jgi:hypothetical protein
VVVIEAYKCKDWTILGYKANMKEGKGLGKERGILIFLYLFNGQAGNVSSLSTVFFLVSITFGHIFITLLRIILGFERILHSFLLNRRHEVLR